MINNPTEIPNCFVWLDGADVSTMGELSSTGVGDVVNGDSVGLWQNKASPFTGDFSSSGAANSTRPTYVSSLSCLRFNNPSNLSQRLRSSFNKTYTSQTVIILAKIVAKHQTSPGIFSQTGTTSVSGMFYPIYSGGSSTTEPIGSIAYNNFGVSTGSSSSTWGIANQKFRAYAANHNGSSFNFYKGYDASGATNHDLNYSVTSTYLGVDDGVTRFIGMDLCEVLVYDRTLTYPEWIDVHFYLYNKWASVLGNEVDLNPSYLIYAIKNGNWSDTTTWSASALPLSSSDVYSNSFTVTADQDAFVQSLRTAALSPNIAGGGTFAITQPNITITASPSGFLAGTTACVTGLLSSGTSFLTGNATGGSVAGAHGVSLQGTGNLTIFGNTLGGSIAAAYGAFHNSSGNLTINGNVSGSSVGVGVFNNSTGNIFINAPQNVRGGAGSAHGVQNNSVGSVYVNGNVVGGTASTARGVINSSAGLVSIVGNLSANVGPAVEQSSTGTVLIDGDIYAYQVGTVNQSGFVSANVNARNEITGSLINGLSGRQAVFATKYLLKPKIFNSYTRMAGSSATNDPVFFYSPEAYDMAYVPKTSSVRIGVQYGAVPVLSGIPVGIPEQLEGTMFVPASTVVSLGTLVDNTTGVAILNSESLQNAWFVNENTINTPNSIGVRLKNIASLPDIGEQIGSVNL